MTAAPTSSSLDFLDRGIHTRRALQSAIRARWSKFTEFEVEALADNNDLVNQVAIKYGLEISRARREVDVVLQGRKL